MEIVILLIIMIGIISNNSGYNTNNSDYIILYGYMMGLYIYIEHNCLVVDLPL